MHCRGKLFRGNLSTYQLKLAKYGICYSGIIGTCNSIKNKDKMQYFRCLGIRFTKSFLMYGDVVTKSVSVSENC